MRFDCLQTFVATATTVVFSGCEMTRMPQGMDILPESAREKVAANWSADHRAGEVVPGWIRSFGDAELTALAGSAVQRNPDLRAAAARVQASQDAVRVAASSLYPRIGTKALGERIGRELSGDVGASIDPADLGGLGVDLAGGAPGSRSLETSSQRSVYGIGIGASWEMDVWGRIRSKKAAAKMESEALAADYEFARQSLAAAVARAYFTTIEAARQEANAAGTLDLYEEYLKLADQRYEQGFASDFDIAQIKSRTAAARDALYAAQSARAAAIRAIEVVTSNYPAGKLVTRRTFPGEPGPVPSGIPSEILERRPDVVAAERRFAASFHRTREARTARLPRFTLSASSGLGTADLDGVGSLDSLTWSLAGGILQPIFFGGELKAAEDIRTSEQRAAAADYVAVALAAFKDVEDGLAEDYYLRLRENALSEMVATSADAVRLGREQFDQGQVDMFTILRLVGENLSANIARTQVQAARLRKRVDLHLALGGSFEAAAQ